MKKINSKRIFVFLTLVFLIQGISNAQEDYEEKYFEQNILKLDPIEGIYDAQIWGQGYNMYQTFPKEYTN